MGFSQATNYLKKLPRAFMTPLSIKQLFEERALDMRCYYIPQLVRALRLVNLAGRALLHDLLKFQVLLLPDRVA